MSADSLSPPGSSSYSSDTLTVGDGTWDFTKNTFLLPNLVGLNFETMRYNGMGNRFSTVPDYHKLILGHGVIAAITFLFVIPIAVLLARFYTRQPGSAVRYHAYLQILAVGLTTVVFVLGFFAVGPPRNLTNPHHGIGVAIYVLILLQAVGGRLVRKLAGRRSFRMHIHRWSGRVITVLGIVQVPLGLTLYGSPKPLFILFAVWMAFLLVLYFILDYRDYGRREHDRGRGHSHAGAGDESSRVTAKSGGAMKWLGPLAAGAGALALFRGRKKNKDAERGLSRSPSPVDRSHRAREPTVISSRRASDSYYDEKQPDRQRVSGASGGGGFMNRIFAAGAGLGAGALVSKMMNRGDKRHEDEYSAVATDTPSRARRHPPPRSEFTESEFTEYTEDLGRRPSRRDAQSSILPAPRPPPAGNRPPRPVTPRRSHAATSRFDSTLDGSDYSSYVSPSRRSPEQRKSGGVGKGLLAGMGLGFLAKMGKDKRDKREEERLRDEEDRRREEEEDRRAGRRNSRYTADGYPSPSRRESRRVSHRPRPPPSGITMTETSVFSEESSIEPRGNTPYDPAPPGIRPPPPAPAPGPGAPPVPGAYAGGPPPIPMPMPIPPMGAAAGQNAPYDVADPALMPPMPSDPHGIFHHPSDASEAYNSPISQRRGRGGDPAAAAAAASASALALAEDEGRRRRREHSRDQASQGGVSVRMRVHDDSDGNVTFRRVPDEEARRKQRRNRGDSLSSHSGNETATSRRYRRDRSSQRRASPSQRRAESSQRRAETAAERRAEAAAAAAPSELTENETLAPLSPPNPAFARRAGGKDSAYYSSGGGLAGSSGTVPAAGATVSTLDSAAGLMSPGGSHATFTSGPLNDAAAADRRRRRRLERRDGSRQPASVDYT
ncbi:hypothetical protein C8A00DRAFT_12384 [Chaetomidium leptoderma]|uniref:Cytochrome b561 domain-containing protein n=1 Tax=Chaetomidium leptoderma TaxID=669021 RepID=A0AAN6ZZP4_9PEZI|nr:hypothetical protein C8A00DRAFT_12384 [Chaetomidium leptoderma]